MEMANHPGDFVYAPQKQQSPNQQQSIYQRNTILGTETAEQSAPDEFIGNGHQYSSATAPRQKKM